MSLEGTGEFTLLHVDLLRRYLDLEFRTMVLPFAFNLEAVIDDLLVLAFMVGNDFLPHVALLQIEQRGLEHLFEAYQRLLPSLGGYLVKGYEVVPERLGALLADVAQGELAALAAEASKVATWQPTLTPSPYPNPHPEPLC